MENNSFLDWSFDEDEEASRTHKLNCSQSLWPGSGAFNCFESGDPVIIGGQKQGILGRGKIGSTYQIILHSTCAEPLEIKAVSYTHLTLPTIYSV